MLMVYTTYDEIGDGLLLLYSHYTVFRQTHFWSND